jgi:murein DD-endopeptidase MepM/ murein hydrolase activator NlpD
LLFVTITSVLTAGYVVAAVQARPAVPSPRPTPAPDSALRTTDNGRRPAPAAVPLPTLPRLGSLIQATVVVSSDRPLGADQVGRIIDASGAHASLLVAIGEVRLGRGRTRVLAADPIKARVWTPSTTGRATGVWQRAAIGEAVVAHAVAAAYGVPLGGSVVVQHRSRQLHLRVGALATTQLPGVGLVVNQAVGKRLGLVPRTGLLLAVERTHPAVTAAVLGHLLGSAAVVDPVLSYALPSAGWVAPAVGPITSPFGMRINPFTHEPQFHEGIDIGAPIGAPVYAMTAGQVLYAGPAAGYGNEVVLSHAGGVTTVYGHVSQILISSATVTTGQVIALVGNEGESTGPHLHAEVHVQDQPVDPVAWLQAHGVRFTH